MNYKRLYINNSMVFVTIVTYQRRNILIDNVELLREAFKNAKQYFKFNIVALVVLEDHIHMILQPENISEYSKIITSVKYYFSHNYKVGVEIPTYGYVNKCEKGIWQRRFYEHTIRDNEDLNRHIDYIHYNSFKHHNILPKDWKYSTFDKFVKEGFYKKNWLVDNTIFEGIDCE